MWKKAGPVSGDDANRGSQLGGPTATEEAEEVASRARDLQDIVTRITPEEFSWQESHYDHDSRRGRELLFLIANHEWVRATSEIIDISRSDAIDTTIKIDIDLDQITHEVFRGRTDPFWLPVTVLPPRPATNTQHASDGQRLEPDPFATVTDAGGNLLPILPTADIRHQMSAAMAEIIVNMAVARWPDADTERPTATRDQRLLLSAAIYRMLRHGSTIRPSQTPNVVVEESEGDASTSRIGKAKKELHRVLEGYKCLLDEIAARTRSKGVNSRSASEVWQFSPELARRAVMVLKALADSVVIVVPVNRATAPTVLAVRIPTRALDSPRVSKLTKPSTWMLRPLGHLEIDMLQPTADADRQVQIHLPDGMSFEKANPTEAKDRSPLGLDIKVGRPQPLEDLKLLMDEILDPGHRERLPALQQCLADLAKGKVAAARETLRHNYFAFAEDQSSSGFVDAGLAATSQARDTLDRLRDALDEPYTRDVPSKELNKAWETFERQVSERKAFSFFRRTSAESPSPRTVVARADMIEDVYQRAFPITARVHADVKVTDGEYFSIARFTGRMSLLLMTAVLVFLAALHPVKQETTPSPEVLAIVLTLFSAIQAGQMESPDHTTVRGLLSTAGNWLIAASILPAVILAVALAFFHSGWVPVIWAGICVGLQLLFQVAMWRGPLTPTGKPRAPQRRRFSTVEPEYHLFEALRSDYWCSTTADALMIGRTAYAYVVWQKKREEEERPPQLEPLLDWETRFPRPGYPPNVLALLRAGTFGQALTFVVFRDEPAKDWMLEADIADRIDFDPDRLAPMESITSVVDVFVGVSRDEFRSFSYHPLVAIVKAARSKLMVLEAQLPVPAPVEGYEGRQWARVRLGLRNNADIRQLAPFLDDIHKNISAVSAGNQRCVVAVQAASTLPPRITTESVKQYVTQSRPVLASDLDITYAAANRGESPDVCAWRVLAFCVDARSYIENDIINKVESAEPQLELTGLAYARLHGMAVMIMIVHEPEGYSGHEGDLDAKLQYAPGPKLRALVNKKLSREQLGPVATYPLLRVHFHWQDRPGALLNVLKSLSKTLEDQLPPIPPDDWSISYTRTQAAAGRPALARLTIRIHIAPSRLNSWDFEEIERKVRTQAALESLAGRGASSSTEALGTPDDPVISINLIRTPAAG
jgi:hypothetical protein